MVSLFELKNIEANIANNSIEHLDKICYDFMLVGPLSQIFQFFAIILSNLRVEKETHFDENLDQMITANCKLSLTSDV